MPIGAVLGVGSALLGASSASKAADAQSWAAEKQRDLEKEMFDTTTGFFEPYREAGENYLNIYQDQLGTEYTKSPGYDHRLQGGLDAITASGVQRGGLNSGAQQKALLEYGQEFAANDRGNWLDRVGGMMSNGQNASGQLAAAGNRYATGAGDAYANMGNASAAGVIGVNNAIQGGIQNGLSLYQYQNDLARPVVNNTRAAVTGNGGLY